MKTSLYHIQINVSDAIKSLPFYKDFFDYFEYKIIDESSEHIGVSNGTTDFWIIETENGFKKELFHRKNTGINHLAFQVSSKDDVDIFFEDFVKLRELPVLYETPKFFPEYGEGYYSLFFEGPDRIKIEVVHKLKFYGSYYEKN